MPEIHSQPPVWPRSLSRTLAGLVVVGTCAWLAATKLRYGLVERGDLGPICDAGGAPWWCTVRALVIRAFLHDAFGLASPPCAALPLWRRSRALAYVAVACGVVGMVLYNFTWAGAGVIAGAMLLSRHQDPRDQDGKPEQHAR